MLFLFLFSIFLLAQNGFAAPVENKPELLPNERKCKNFLFKKTRITK